LTMVVIGLGSPFLCDDSVGPRVVRALSRRKLTGVRLVEAHAGGLLLLEELAGEQRAVIVDALVDPTRAPGEVIVAGVGSAGRNASCSHDCSLPEALLIGRAMGMDLPEDGEIYTIGIVAGDVETFSETLTPQVAEAVEAACDLICACFDSDENITCTEAA
jgi:hydrogenase maturation protease